jgi:hypothetical protein
LARFFNNNVPGHAAQVFALGSYDFKYDATGHLYGTGFCNGWYDNITTLTNIRSGLCTMASAHRWINPSLLYLLICTAVAAIYLLTHFQLERRSLSPQSEMRRRAIELSIVTTVCACFIFSHYYYLIALIIPFNVLLAIVLSDGRYGAFGWWCVSYVLVSALVVPMTLLSRIAGFDVWEPYVFHACYWYGEVLLVLLLLHEYRRLASLAAVSA